MATSARNQLSGTIVSVSLETVMAEVVVDVGGQQVVAAITKDSAERLGPRPGRSSHRDHQGHGRDIGTG